MTHFLPECLQLLLRGKIGHVLGGEDLLFIFGQRVTDDRVVFLRAEDDTHRRVIPGIHQLTGVVIDIHLHLPQILMGQLPGFKVY